jgi:hypothetical protein
MKMSPSKISFLSSPFCDHSARKMNNEEIEEEYTYDKIKEDMKRKPNNDIGLLIYIVLRELN